MNGIQTPRLTKIQLECTSFNMDRHHFLTIEEVRVIKDALKEYSTLNEDGMDAYYRPKDREIAITLYRKLDETYIIEDK